MAIGDNSKLVVQPGLDRSQVKSLVVDALTAVIRRPKAEAVDERHELYADLGMDSLVFAQLLVELEVRLNVHLVDEELMTIELVTVADLIDLVGRILLPAEKCDLDLISAEVTAWLARRETRCSLLTGSTSCTTGPSMWPRRCRDQKRDFRTLRGRACNFSSRSRSHGSPNAVTVSPSSDSGGEISSTWW